MRGGRYWTTVWAPFAFDALTVHTCQHSEEPCGGRPCTRPAVYRAELDGADGPDGMRVITCWCAEHAALWRTASVPPRLLTTLAAP